MKEWEKVVWMYSLQSFLHGWYVLLLGGKNKQNYKIDENKQVICTWICQNWTKADFKNFEEIFEIIEDIIS